MNRTKKFLYNSATTAIYQFVFMIVGFITPRIMLKYYGSEINGLVSSITQFITYINLVEAGLSGAAIYALYKPLANNDHKGINSIVSATKKFYNISGYIFVILVGLLAFTYPIFVNSEIITGMEIGMLVIVLGVSGTLELFTLGKYRALLSADQKTYVISIASTIHIILNTVIIFILAKMNANVIILRTIALLSVFVRSIILTVYVKKKYSYISYKEKPNYKALDKRWDALFLQVLGTIQNGAPIVIATICTSLKQVSVFSIFNMVMIGINGILGIFISGLAASFGDLIARNETGKMQRAYKEFEFVYYLLISIVYSISFFMIMPFIKVYTSGIYDVNYNIPILGFLFVLNGLLYNIKTPQGMLVISAGLYKETKIQTAIQGLITVILGFILGYYFGLVGIISASCLANLYRDIDLMFFIPKNVTKLKVKDTLKNIKIIIAIFLITFIATMYIKITANSMIEWLKYSIITSICVIVISIIIGIAINRRETVNVIKRMKIIGGIKK